MELRVWPDSSPKTPTHHTDVESFEVEENGCLLIYYKESKDFPDRIEGAKKSSHYKEEEWIRFQATGEKE
ncbi:MAG: hypothetical protein SVV03_02645 [Candidatus Nanohaloarchaea archaeon]|nr:hypothetical protein [Candidatus Nanohaloarchaea archaeon]